MDFYSELLCKTSQFEAVVKTPVKERITAANSSAKRVSLRRNSFVTVTEEEQGKLLCKTSQFEADDTFIIQFICVEQTPLQNESV